MQSNLKKYIGIIRSFNRYYTNVLGLLNQHFLDSPYSLSEVRILHEIEKTEQCTASMLADTLSMDVGYLSRILKKFQKSGLIEKKKSAEDRRSQYLTVTPFGKENQDQFNDRSDQQIEKLVETLPEEEIKVLARNMTSIETILTKGKNIRRSDITIRDDVRPGDAGYLTYLHGWIYKKNMIIPWHLRGMLQNPFISFWFSIIRRKTGCGVQSMRERSWAASVLWVMGRGPSFGGSFCTPITGEWDLGKIFLNWLCLLPEKKALRRYI